MQWQSRSIAGSIVRPLRAAYRKIRRHVVYDTLLYPYAAYRFRDIERNSQRSSTHTYTRFRRAPLQMEALTGPVLDFLGKGSPPRSVSVLVFGGSTGAEAYTVASELLDKCGPLDFQITSSDLDQALVRKATEALYSEEEIRASAEADASFVTRTFERRDASTLRIREELRSRVSFTQADLLSDDLTRRFDPADILFVQNVLCHMSAKPAEQAFRAVTQLMRPRSALFVDGMNLDLKVALTKSMGLEPLAYRYRDIYAHARKHIPLKWWRYYYAAEPMRLLVRERVRRYSTIFLREP